MLVAELELLNLPRRGHRKVLDESHVLRHLELRQRLGAPASKLFGQPLGRGFRLRPDRRRDRLPEVVVADTVYVRVGNRWMFAKAILHFLRRDVLAAANDQILDAPGDAITAVRVDARFVTGTKPAIGVDRRAGRLRIVVVALHDVIPARAQFTALAARTLEPAGRIDDAR